MPLGKRLDRTGIELDPEGIGAEPQNDRWAGMGTVSHKPEAGVKQNLGRRSPRTLAARRLADDYDLEMELESVDYRDIAHLGHRADLIFWTPDRNLPESRFRSERSLRVRYPVHRAPAPGHVKGSHVSSEV